MITELPYTPNAESLFSLFAHSPGAIFFDGGQPYDARERFSIIVADPIVKIIVKENKTTIVTPHHQHLSLNDPIDIVKDYLQQLHRSNTEPLPTTLPFRIGAAGYFSYDFAKRYFRIQPQTIADIGLPEAVIGIYDWSIVIDHHDKKTWLITLKKEKTDALINILKTPTKPASFTITSPFQSNLTAEQYEKAFQKIKTHIRHGDCYQVNLCQRFSATFKGSPWEAYRQIRSLNPTPFSVFMSLEQQALLCFSPERFLRVRNGGVETKPIKGTAARYKNPLDDQRSAQALLQSRKDNAENVMIVDLLRNDLAKSCRPHSIHVPQLAALESFPNVHHLVSTITGQLRDDQHSLDLLKNCLPGGSITGAPKQRAMQVIESLEPHQRSVYCGSMGYIDIDGDMDCNIAIRTLICDKDNIHCSAGGAIVDDSDCQSEYKESIIKVSHLLKILSSLKTSLSGLQ